MVQHSVNLKSKKVNKISHIGVLTSGGDAPGMNACIRAIVRTALHENIEISGITHGFQGLVDGGFKKLHSRSVSNIIQQGGTILKTARCEEFKTPEGRKKAYENLLKHNINGLIVIGGDGTLTGAHTFSQEYNIPIMGVPGTIDNDLHGTDYTLGYDTATNTVIEAIDKIRDTAASHERLFFIEVMGRDSGCIALNAGIAGGAEAILLPEKPISIDTLCNLIERGKKGKKTSTIVIVAEGEAHGGAYKVAQQVKEVLPMYDTKVTILGHLQRGGAPSSFDRVLASRLGFVAVKQLLKGNKNHSVGFQKNEITLTPFEEAIKEKNIKFSDDLLEIAQVLAQ